MRKQTFFAGAVVLVLFVSILFSCTPKTTVFVPSADVGKGDSLTMARNKVILNN